MNCFQAPKDYQILFLDMNSFFASVEQQVQPNLRGKPIGVAPFTGDTGCIIAASKEAKKLGIKIGRVSEAKKLCPSLKIIEARPALYMLYHKEIKQVIEQFSPYFIPLSIDEFVIKLTPREQNYKNAFRLGLELKKAIQEKVGDWLTCSVGVGPNRFLAKMAGERKKPDGLTILQLKNLRQFYLNLDNLTDITGINYRMEARLRLFGINKPIDFFDCSLFRLREILDHWGRLWYFRLRGYEVDEYASSSKTIGHSHVLPPEFRSKSGAESVIRKLILKTGYRLRKEGYFATGVSVVIGFMDRGNFALSKRVSQFSDSYTLTDHISNLLSNCRWQSRPIYVSLNVFGLTKPVGRQISIFKEIEKRQSIARAIDLVNDEYGSSTIYPASTLASLDTAPDRIPFGSPRYEILH